MFNTIFLGKGREYSTDPAVTGINNNIVVVGGSGSGKTMSVMEMKLLRNEGRSMIVNVSKRKLIWKYTRYFQEKGFDVKCLDMSKPMNGDVSFDPLHYIHGLDDSIGIQNLAESIVCAQQDISQQKDPYWPMSAMHLLMAEIYYVLSMDRHATFADVLKYHDDLQINPSDDDTFQTNHDNDFAALPEGNPAHRYWRTFRQNARNTAMCIYTELNSPLQTMFPPEYRKGMHAKPQIDACSMAEHPSILFVYTSPVNKELHTVANLFMSFAIQDLYNFAESRRSGTLPVPIDLVFDDFACGSKVRKFPELISIFREKGISTTIMLQSEDQLSAMYGEADARIILDNCDTYLYMGSMNARNAENVAWRCNLPAEVILALKIGKEVLFRRGETPQVFDRYDITNDPGYQKLTSRFNQWIAEEGGAA